MQPDAKRRARCAEGVCDRKGGAGRGVSPMLHKPPSDASKAGGARKHGDTACDVYRRPLRLRGTESLPS